MTPGARAGWAVVGSIAITAYLTVAVAAGVTWRAISQLHGRRYADRYQGAEAMLSHDRHLRQPGTAVAPPGRI